MRRVLAGTAAGFLLVPPAGASPVVLNEVLYDPEGADGSREFVELASVPEADPEVSLEGWVLETGNGARPGEWKVAWVGTAADRLHGGLFLVGESGVEPAPDAVVDLDLQNGPDACRVLGPAGEEDLLGWGDGLDASLSEGSPAEDVAPGLSLARIPDGLDTDANARDFLPSAPGPGEYNAPEVALALEALSFPPAGWPAGRRWTFVAVIRNVGRLPAPAEVRLRCDVHPGEALAVAPAGVLGPGERKTLSFEASPPPGLHVPRSDPPAPAAAAPWPGPGADLVLSEVLNRPRPGEPEWIEVECLAAVPVDLAAFRVEDAAGSSASLGGVLPPGGFAILAPDTARLGTRWAVPAGALLVETSPWPALNHAGAAGGVVERVVLRVGEIAAAAASLPGGAGEGVAWERRTRYLDGDDLASWSPSLDPAGGTPGRRNSRNGDRVLPPGATREALSVHPSPFRPARDAAVLLVLRPPRPAPSCRMTVFDSSGIPVAELAPWAVGPREHRALWDGRDASGEAVVLGLYVIRAEAPGSPPFRGTLVLVR